MSRQDITRWQHKYADVPTHSLSPDPLLEQHAQLLQGPGIALDLACGRGRNSLFLAQLGKTVYAVDGSLLAVRGLHKQAHHIHTWVADLEYWQPPGAIFDLIVVNYFLHRPLFPSLVTALRSRGLLLYQSFNQNVLRQRPGFSPSYLLHPGELQQAFSGLTILASNDALDNVANSSFVLARNPSNE